LHKAGAAQQAAVAETGRLSRRPSHKAGGRLSRRPSQKQGGPAGGRCRKRAAVTGGRHEKRAAVTGGRHRNNALGQDAPTTAAKKEGARRSGKALTREGAEPRNQ
jgi:hypothetical protein